MIRAKRWAEIRETAWKPGVFAIEMAEVLADEGHGALATLVVLGLGACASAVWWASAGKTATAIALMVAAPIAGRAVSVDLATFRLPNRLVWAIAAVGATYALVEATRDRRGALAGALIGMVAAALPMLVVHLISRGRLGFGDVKLAGALGLLAGAAHPLYAVVIPLVASTLGLFGGRGRRAFGPAIAAGAVVAMLFVPMWVRSIGGQLLWV